LHLAVFDVRPVDLLARAYAADGDEVLFSEHSFLIFPIVARSVGATPVTVPERNLTVDVDALLSRVGPSTRIVFVANPSNPTGSYVNRTELARLCAALPGEVLLVIDAAYSEFVTKPDYTPGFELVDDHPNVVVACTFSKIHGLAALRLGWAYCPSSVADILNRLRAPFNVAGPTQRAGIAALEDAALAQHDDLVGIHHGRQAVSQHDDAAVRALAAQMAQVVEDGRLGAGVHGRQRIVQHQQRTVTGTRRGLLNVPWSSRPGRTWQIPGIRHAHHTRGLR